MKNTFTLLATGFLLSVATALQAQDPQFIQFYASPLNLNPAMTGVHPGKWRAVANYREQWNSILDTRPYRTVSAGYDVKFNVNRNDYFAFGITALRDQAGSSNYLRQSGDLSFSYLKQLDGGRYRSSNQYLVGGGSLGFGQHSLDYQNLWFTSQFDNSTEQVNETLPNGELIADKSDLYLNLNAGLMWYGVFDDNASLYFGGAINHANQPKVSFIDANGEESLEMRWVGHAGGEVPFSHEFSMLPAVMVTGQGPSLLSLFGANFRYTNRDWKELAIRAGAWGHLVKDLNNPTHLPAVTFSAVLEVERWNIGVSYDVAANKLASPTNGRGAYEISLIYYQPANRREKVRCPKY